MEQDLARKNIGQRLFRDAFVLLVLVGVLDYIGVKLYLFWTLHYYDSLVHFTAGITVGLGSVWLWMQLSKGRLTQKHVVWSAFVGALVVGVVWEIFELTNGITLLSDGIHYVTDTSSDLLMDVSGGLIAALYACRAVLKNNITHG